MSQGRCSLRRVNLRSLKGELAKPDTKSQRTGIVIRHNSAVYGSVLGQDGVSLALFRVPSSVMSVKYLARSSRPETHVATGIVLPLSSFIPIPTTFCSPVARVSKKESLHRVDCNMEWSIAKGNGYIRFEPQ